MKKLLKPIVSKFGILLTGVAIMLLASCSNKQTAISSINNRDIIWKSGLAENVTPVEKNTITTAEKELTKTDFKEIISSQIAASKGTSKLSLKETVATNLIANKLNKTYQKLSPTKKAEIKAELEKQRASGGLKQAVLVILVGIGVCILAGLFGSILGILGTLVWVIGALVILYGIWLALEELVF